MSVDPRHAEKREWRLSHPESVRKSNRKQYLKNRAKRLAYGKRYALKHRNQIRNRMTAYHHDTYYPRNRSKILSATKRYAQLHPEVRRKCHVNYITRHPDRYKAQWKASNRKQSLRRLANCK